MSRLFYIFSSADFIAKFGDVLHEMFLILFLIKLTDSSSLQIGVVYFIRFLPYIFLGLVGGAIADKFPRKRLMVFSDLTRFLLVCVMLLLFHSESLSFEITCLIVFSFTIVRIIFQPAFQSTIPDMVLPSTLGKANSLVQTSQEVASILAPLAGALLVNKFSLASLLVLDATTYVISAVMIQISVPRFAEKSGVRLEANVLWETLKEGYAHVIELYKNKNIINVILPSAIAIMFVGSVLRIFIPLYINESFPDSEVVIGYTMGTISAGTVIGAICYSYMIKKTDIEWTLIFWILYGMAILPFALTTGLVSLVIVAFILGLVGALVDISIVTNIQQFSTKEDMGKNFSAFSSLANFGEALSGALGGLFASFFGPAVGLIAFSILTASSSASWLVSLRKRNRTKAV